ncbi:MAG TPA: CBS domain-containing protein [Gemmatimonadales bacterium]
MSAAGPIMVENNLRGLPVAERHGDDPVLVGMVSRGDILRG